MNAQDKEINDKAARHQQEFTNHLNTLSTAHNISINWKVTGIEAETPEKQAVIKELSAQGSFIDTVRAMWQDRALTVTTSTGNQYNFYCDLKSPTKKHMHTGQFSLEYKEYLIHHVSPITTYLFAVDHNTHWAYYFTRTDAIIQPKTVLLPATIERQGAEVKLDQTAMQDELESIRHNVNAVLRQQGRQEIPEPDYIRTHMHSQSGDAFALIERNQAGIVTPQQFFGLGV